MVIVWRIFLLFFYFWGDGNCGAPNPGQPTYIKDTGEIWHFEIKHDNARVPQESSESKIPERILGDDQGENLLPPEGQTNWKPLSGEYVNNAGVTQENSEPGHPERTLAEDQDNALPPEGLTNWKTSSGEYDRPSWDTSSPLEATKVLIALQPDLGGVEVPSQPQLESVDMLPRSPRAYDYMALDSYANPVTEDYCPPSPPSKSKFSVFGFLGMMVSLSMTVANVINAINNNNNNNDNNNNDNNNNNNDINAAAGGGDGGGGGGGGGGNDPPVRNSAPVRINSVGQQNSNSDLGSDGFPVLTNARPVTSNPNTISFGGRSFDFDYNSISSFISDRSFSKARSHGGFEYGELDNSISSLILDTSLPGYDRFPNDHLKKTATRQTLKSCSCKSKKSSSVPEMNSSYLSPKEQETLLHISQREKSSSVLEKTSTSLPHTKQGNLLNSHHQGESWVSPFLTSPKEFDLNKTGKENSTNNTGKGAEWVRKCVQRFLCEQELEMRYSVGLNLMFSRLTRVASYSLARKMLSTQDLSQAVGDAKGSSCQDLMCPIFRGATG